MLPLPPAGWRLFQGSSLILLLLFAVVLSRQSTEQRQGYDEAVDWWSLGVTVYKMLTGMRPFDPPPWARKKSVVALLRRQTEFEKLQAGVRHRCSVCAFSRRRMPADHAHWAQVLVAETKHARFGGFVIRTFVAAVPKLRPAGTCNNCRDFEERTPPPAPRYQNSTFRWITPGICRRRQWLSYRRFCNTR